MTSNQILIIRNYLMRTRWYYLGGFVIHLIAMTNCWWTEKPMMIGIFSGSAFLLMIELNRGGNITTRTMLSLPVTAGQLARCWRFVALAFPAVFFLVALLLSAALGAIFHAPELTLEFLVLLGIGQTMLLGVIYFAATGIPGQPRSGATLAQYLCDGFFGAIWGLSIPSTMFLFRSIPSHVADFNRVQIAAAILLGAGTLAGWLRADVLVRERAARPGPGKSKIDKQSQDKHPQSWTSFGALPYLFTRFGVMFLLMMLATLLFFSILQGGLRSMEMLVGMFLSMFSLMAVIQMLSQLRILRTMPIRTSTLTHCLLFWPIAVAMLVGLCALAILKLLHGVPIHWTILRNAVIAASSMQLVLPLALRFGSRPWIILPVPMLTMMGFHLVSEPYGLVPAIHWLWPLACVFVSLAIIWRVTYRLLATPHPWRAGAMKWQALARRM